ncbi:phosphate ABC transporter permease PstA [Rhodococcus artemisiae]|uniref:Phosphate transport system permease protein PstA n=1 Tax=Rhodococcus artemisiae TaxID=714159 RepID=A0ABU7LJN2_9NOCA|nr:phosphate ABC transporter permease PstA [Rhodococcus artemisiae]MEE2061776.1 phosphate ABC transporter permease PstA [Rhodococcus artemisiae]
MSLSTTTRDSVAPIDLAKGQRSNVRSGAFAALLWTCLALACLFLLAVLVVILTEGWARFDANLITEQPSRLAPETSGVQSAIFGTLWVMLGTILLALPIGIAGGIYLEEYADNTKWWNRLIELNIQNLVAVPSIIYGILTLAFVVRGPISIGPVALAGSVALALLILPVIIITTREALRAVPQEIRQGSLALGATQWQTTWRQVLPSAVSGISTGTILALSRAIGEAAPLLLVGATVFITVNPDGLLDRYTVLPVQIFNLVKLPELSNQQLAWATILLLMVILLAMNGIAIWLRNRFQRRW